MALEKFYLFITGVLQWCDRGVTGMIQKCYIGVTVFVIGCYMDVKEALQRYCRGV